MPEIEETLLFLAIDPVIAIRLIYSVVAVVGFYFLASALSADPDIQFPSETMSVTLQRGRQR